MAGTPSKEQIPDPPQTPLSRYRDRLPLLKRDLNLYLKTIAESLHERVAFEVGNADTYKPSPKPPEDIFAHLDAMEVELKNFLATTDLPSSCLEPLPREQLDLDTLRARARKDIQTNAEMLAPLRDLIGTLKATPKQPDVPEKSDQTLDALSVFQEPANEDSLLMELEGHDES